LSSIRRVYLNNNRIQHAPPQLALLPSLKVTPEPPALAWRRKTEKIMQIDILISPVNRGSMAEFRVQVVRGLGM
jgi:hypothetical protein